MNNLINQNIVNALEKVEHPSIATTLLSLGILRDIKIDLDGKVALALVLPFSGIPNNIIQYMTNALYSAAQSAGGELTKVSLAVMNEEERQNFLIKEQQNWRG
ncbi:MAG: iron-sulfur cluster assembly protein [Anaerolineales bacterium]